MPRSLAIPISTIRTAFARRSLARVPVEVPGQYHTRRGCGCCLVLAELKPSAIGGLNKMDTQPWHIPMIVTTFATIASESRYDLLPSSYRGFPSCYIGCLTDALKGWAQPIGVISERIDAQCDFRARQSKGSLRLLENGRFALYETPIELPTRLRPEVAPRLCLGAQRP